MIPRRPDSLPAFLALLCTVAALAGLPDAAAGAPTIECHCFKDREYDPANPGKTDVYLLATTTNTFMSAAFGFPKKDVVRGRMSGVSGENFWIAAYAADRLGVARDELLERRERQGSWRGVFTALGSPLEPLGPLFVGALAGGADDAPARAAAAETLVRRLDADRGEIDGLTKLGATVQETVLAVFLGRWSRRPAAEIYERVKSGAVTWSGALAGLGRTPTRMETEIPRELKPAPPP